MRLPQLNQSHGVRRFVLCDWLNCGTRVESHSVSEKLSLECPALFEQQIQESECRRSASVAEILDPTERKQNANLAEIPVTAENSTTRSPTSVYAQNDSGL